MADRLYPTVLETAMVDLWDCIDHENRRHVRAWRDAVHAADLDLDRLNRLAQQALRDRNADPDPRSDYCQHLAAMTWVNALI